MIGLLVAYATDETSITLRNNKILLNLKVNLKIVKGFFN